MKNIYLTLLFFLPLSVQAQVVTVSEDIVMRNDVGYQVIGAFKDRILLFRDQTTQFEVQAFDQNMRETWSKKLELDKRLPVVMDLNAMLDNHFSLLYRFRNKAETLVKVHKFDPAANLVDSATVKNYGYLFYTPDFEVIRSQDRTKLLVYYIERQSIIHATSFDLDSMRTIWDKTFTPEDFDATQDVVHTVVDNQGTFYLIIEKNNLRYRREAHYYEVHQFSGEDDQYKRYNIPHENSRLTYDVSFIFDNPNGFLKGGGLYAENNPGRSTGYFFLSVPRDNVEGRKLIYEPFDNDFIASLMGKEIPQDKDNKGIMESAVQEVVLRKDGGLLIIGERTRQYERRMAATNRVAYDTYSRYIVDYFYDDLFVLAVHPDGKPHWKQVLHKKQYSQDDDGAFSSYFLFKSPRHLHIMFNDEIRYENTVSEYVVDGKGDLDRNSILSTANLKLRLRFRDAMQVGAHEVIIPSERRNALRLVKVTF